ncbi:MAG: hypothetical protein QOE14_1832 [Humisphaera sp.]|nr:hypothetical protein [Humisphaera sp.]
MANQALLRRRVLAAVLVGSIVTSGCTRTITHQIAKYEPGKTAGPTTRPVPSVAMWKVKVRERGEKEYHGIDGTERWLQQGDIVGFRTAEDGVVYAVANRDVIPLELTSEHRRVVWYASKEKPTRFGRTMDAALRVTGAVAFGAGMVVLLLWSLDQRDEANSGSSFGNGH